MRASPHFAEEFDVALCMTQLHTGSQEAARALHDRYAGFVFHIIRRRYNRRFRGRLDAEDFAQEVWAVFFAMPRQRFLTFATEKNLMGYLARLATNKVVDRCRQLLGTEKHNLNREVALGQVEFEGPRACSPEHVAIAKEEWGWFLRGFPERKQAILRLLRDNWSQTEVAEKLAISSKTVQRFHRLIIGFPHASLP